MPTTALRRFSSLFKRSYGFVEAILDQCAAGKSSKVRTSSSASPRSCTTSGNRSRSVAQTVASCAWAAARLGCVNTLPTAARTIDWAVLGTRFDVSKEVHFAALPGRPDADLGERGLQARVGVGDDQLHPAQAAP